MQLQAPGPPAPHIHPKSPPLAHSFTPPVGCVFGCRVSFCVLRYSATDAKTCTFRPRTTAAHLRSVTSPQLPKAYQQG
eukprot:scaffold129149_cov48-Phaeocystis_antarctica.AAC.1